MRRDYAERVSANVMLAALHRYTPKEVAELFIEAKISPTHAPGTGIYFVDATRAEQILYKQDAEMRHLRAKVSKLQSAHDKLFAQLKRYLTKSVKEAERAAGEIERMEP